MRVIQMRIVSFWINQKKTKLKKSKLISLKKAQLSRNLLLMLLAYQVQMIAKKIKVMRVMIVLKKSGK